MPDLEEERRRRRKLLEAGVPTPELWQEYLKLGGAPEELQRPMDIRPPKDSAPQATPRGSTTLEKVPYGRAEAMDRADWPAIDDAGVPAIPLPDDPSAGPAAAQAARSAADLAAARGEEAPEDRALRVGERILGAIQAPDVEGRDLTGTSARAEIPNEGRRASLFGHDTSDLFDPEVAKDRASEAYRALGPQEARDAHEWEQRYLEARGPISDRDINRTWGIMNFFGSGDQADRFRESQIRRQESYAQGRMQARDRDIAESRRGKRISEAMAQTIAASGLVDPEVAVTLTEDDPLVQKFFNGAYTLGAKFRGQQSAEHIHAEKQLGGIESDRLNALVKLTGIQADVLLGALGIEQKAAAAEGTLPPAARAGMLASASGASVQEVQQYLAAKESGGPMPATLSARQVEVLDRVAPGIDLMKAKDVSGLVKAGLLKEGDVYRAVETATARVASDPAKNREALEELKSMARAVQNASSAWHAMSDDAKALFVQVGKSTPLENVASDFLTKWKGRPEDQAHAGAIQDLVNTLLRAMSGAAVTENESGRFAAAAGVTVDGWNPFREPGAFTAFLQRAQQTALDRRDIYESTFQKPTIRGL